MLIATYEESSKVKEDVALSTWEDLSSSKSRDEEEKSQSMFDGKLNE